MLTHRYIARFELEADTPLFVGSLDASLLTDAVVQKDANGYPMILGTSLAGVLRHVLASESCSWCNRLFGEASSKNGQGTGSLLKVSSAYIKLSNKQVAEGIIFREEDESDSVFTRYENLPARQHVRITHKGVADDRGLYNNEIVYKGSRFVFELELVGTEEDKKNWEQLLGFIQSPVFRIGAGTRKGYGSMKVIGLFQETFDLTVKSELFAYLDFDASFKSALNFKSPAETNANNELNGFSHYRLELQPDTFFIFSDGFGDAEVDNKPLEEDVVVYSDTGITYKRHAVIPATSIKGAVSHRTAFHYNRLIGAFADFGEGLIGDKNHAVFHLFGSAGPNSRDTVAGKVYINDWYYPIHSAANNKIFNHVAIDRFTGGAMDGALFSEKVTHLSDTNLTFDIYVKNTDNIPEYIMEAFEAALVDIAKGLLPLGGMSTKGNGIFTGCLSRNGEEMYNYNIRQ